MRVKNRAPLALWARRERFCDPFTGGRGLSELSQGSAEAVYLLIHVVMDTKILLRTPQKAKVSETKTRFPKRAPFEFYPTPPEATRALLSVETFDGTIWEPACGD